MVVCYRNVKKAEAKKRGLEKVIGFSKRSVVTLERVLMEWFEGKCIIEAKEEVCCEGNEYE